jgi:hypothetical protein
VVQWCACLPLYPRFLGSNPAKGDELFKGNKNLQLAFEEEVKPSAPCRKILRLVKYIFEV